jgi:hypothetical protein
MVSQLELSAMRKRFTAETQSARRVNAEKTDLQSQINSALRSLCAPLCVSAVNDTFNFAHVHIATLLKISAAAVSESL